MTAATGTVSRVAASPFPLDRGLLVFIWLLPLHVLAITLLFGALGLPAPTVRAIAAWKEALIAFLTAGAVAGALFGRGVKRDVAWLDLCVAGLGVIAVCYLAGANFWFGTELPAGARLYGLRDTVFFTLLYFVGRASPGVLRDRRVLGALVAVGLLTSVLAILERLLAPPETLVLLGAARYFQDFLGVAPMTEGNVYGLPSNYWTLLGDQMVRRVGSTYLSSQGFAIPFLLVMPAATMWLLRARPSRRWLAWTGYLVLWVALLLTLTRLTIAVCAIQTVVLALLLRRWGLGVGVGLAAMLMLAAGILLVPGFWRFLWETLTWQSGSSVSHLEDWSQGLENMLRYPLGVGLGSTDQTAVRFGLAPLAADNQYLKYAVELGAVGLGLHVATLVGALAAGARLYWTSPEAAPERAYGGVIALGALGIMVNANTAVVFNSLMLSYVFFWLVGAAVTLVREPSGVGSRP